MPLDTAVPDDLGYEPRNDDDDLRVDQSARHQSKKHESGVNFPNSDLLS